MLLVAFLLVNAPNCHLSLVLPSAVQRDAVNCNINKIYLKEFYCSYSRTHNIQNGTIFRMVLYTYCYYFLGQHCCSTETNTLVDNFVFFYKFAFTSTLLLPPFCSNVRRKFPGGGKVSSQSYDVTNQL